MPNMMRYKLKKPNISFNNYKDNQVYYNTVKEELIAVINNNKETIFLIGSGANGKSYLTNELHDFLNLNNYSVYHNRFYMCNNATTFNSSLNSITGKKVIHLLFNPFNRWNILEPVNSEVISMDHVHF